MKADLPNEVAFQENRTPSPESREEIIEDDPNLPLNQQEGYIYEIPKKKLRLEDSEDGEIERNDSESSDKEDDLLVKRSSPPISDDSVTDTVPLITHKFLALTSEGPDFTIDCVMKKEYSGY